MKVMLVASITMLDIKAQSAEDVITEQRSQDEILPSNYNESHVNALNPMLDVTPAELISVIVAEKGVIESPDASKMQVLIN